MTQTVKNQGPHATLADFDRLCRELTESKLRSALASGAIRFCPQKNVVGVEESVK